ncbi:MAG: glycoside hydrolase [Flavobacteriaceae bacterium]|nr:glycoside hydrolase [Flavobacteriaceae bacterium]
MKLTIRLSFLCFISILFVGCAQTNQKINGVSFVASSQEAQQENIQPVLQLNANHASVMPFGFIKNTSHPELIYNSDRQWFGETLIGAKQYIELLHKNKIQVMLKPQIWIYHGEFTGFLKMDSEEKWKQLEQSYKAFILDYAQLAHETNVLLFCIGTELEQFIKHRPQYWKELIKEIRTIYKGKLTYAANWDEYKRVPFWNELDYIGVDAYFPISEQKTPSLEESRSAWLPWKNEMIALSEATEKKILFTEFGYRSVDFSGKEPWVSNRNMNQVNLEAQNNTTKALFEEVWDESWFAGGYLWKWFINHDEVGGRDNFMFTPQNKPVESIIREYYKNKN